jgi:hypothetical protein
MARLRMQPNSRIRGENTLVLTLDAAEFKSLFKVYPRAGVTAFKVQGNMEPLDLELVAVSGGKLFKSSSFGYAIEVDPFEVGIDQHVPVDLQVEIEVSERIRVVNRQKEQSQALQEDVTQAILKMAKKGFSKAEFEAKFAGHSRTLSELRKSKQIVLRDRKYRLPEIDMDNSSNETDSRKYIDQVAELIKQRSMSSLELCKMTGLSQYKVRVATDYLLMRGQIGKDGRQWIDRSGSVEFLLKKAGGRGLPKANVVHLPNPRAAWAELRALIDSKKVLDLPTSYRWANRFEWHDET